MLTEEWTCVPDVRRVKQIVYGLREERRGAGKELFQIVLDGEKG